MKKNNKKTGYTIIETMIAVSLFIIIVMIGMGTLLNANLLHQKSQNMRSIIDNLSFVMEDMSRNLRTGYDYHCIDNSYPSTTDFTPRNCINGGWGISFKSTSVSAGGQWVYYIGTYNGVPGIFKSVSGGVENSFIPLTSDEIIINPSSSFIVSGAESGDGKQPFVTIKLIGKITYRNIESPFSLQTSVSQRVLDF